MSCLNAPAHHLGGTVTTHVIECDLTLKVVRARVVLHLSAGFLRITHLTSSLHNDDWAGHAGYPNKRACEALITRLNLWHRLQPVNEAGQPEPFIHDLRVLRHYAAYRSSDDGEIDLIPYHNVDKLRIKIESYADARSLENALKEMVRHMSATPYQRR